MRHATGGTSLKKRGSIARVLRFIYAGVLFDFNSLSRTLSMGVADGVLPSSHLSQSMHCVAYFSGTTSGAPWFLTAITRNLAALVLLAFLPPV